jgi:ketosteroid isomerase-like protein
MRDRDAVDEVTQPGGLLAAEIEGLPIGYAAFSRGDYEQALVGLDPEIDFIVPEHLVPEEHVFHGHAGVRRFWALGRQEFESWRIEPGRLVAVPPNRVLVYATETLRGRSSQAESAIETFHLWEFRDALATRCEVFFDREAALQAAGVGA